MQRKLEFYVASGCIGYMYLNNYFLYFLFLFICFLYVTKLIFFDEYKINKRLILLKPGLSIH